MIGIVVGVSVLVLVIAVVGGMGMWARETLSTHASGLERAKRGEKGSERGVNSSNEYSKAHLEAIEGGEGREVRVMLLIAHPDDETMFFGPTLLGLASKYREQEANVVVYIHCLSKGIECGEERAEELKKAAPILGVPEERVFVDDMQDGDDWKVEEVEQRLARTIMRWKVDVVLTFDSHGVSGHKNHKSCFHAAELFWRRSRAREAEGGDWKMQYMTNEGDGNDAEHRNDKKDLDDEASLFSSSSPSSSGSKTLPSSSSSSSSSRRLSTSQRDTHHLPSTTTRRARSNSSTTAPSLSSVIPRTPHFFSLRSSSFLAKYSGPLLFPFALSSILPLFELDHANHPLLFANPHPPLIHRAMLAHHSQYVWFRRLYILSSQFVFYNTLDPIL